MCYLLWRILYSHLQAVIVSIIMFSLENQELWLHTSFHGLVTVPIQSLGKGMNVLCYSVVKVYHFPPPSFVWEHFINSFDHVYYCSVKVFVLV